MRRAEDRRTFGFIGAAAARSAGATAPGPLARAPRSSWNEPTIAASSSACPNSCCAEEDVSSTAAFSASKFVWNAISLMSLMICEVLSAAARIFDIAPLIWSMTAAPSVAATRAVAASAFAF